MEDFLYIENIHLKAGTFSLKGITLSIRKGSYFVLLGPTGSGKTLLLETVAGIRMPAAGRILVDGKDITHCEPEKRNIGFMYQDSLLFPHLSVMENIAFSLRARRLPKDAIIKRLHEVAALVGIEHLLNRMPDGLSGGEKQRVSLARALAHKPWLLLLDEPLSALDPETRRILRHELRRIHAQSGCTVIHVTHDFEEALYLADRLGVIFNGTILQEGDPFEVFKKPKTPEVARFTGTENIFLGVVKREMDSDGHFNAVFETGSIKIRCISDREGKCFASIRPEEIIISLDPPRSSARNIFKGIVEDILQSGPLCRINVKCGEKFVVLTTHQSIEDMDIKEGKEVYISFKATGVHIF